MEHSEKKFINMFTEADYQWKNFTVWTILQELVQR